MSRPEKYASERVIHKNDVEELFGRWEHVKDEDGRVIMDPTTCGTCGRTWNDARSTALTPTPSARCPFEYEHDEEDEEDDNYDGAPYELGEPENGPGDAQERQVEAMRFKR